MSGWRAYNGMQVFGGVLNAHDNFSQGHYFWGALDVVGVMFSTSQLLKACFAAGTPIRTANGSKPVEEIVAGDYVLSRDENDPNGPILLKLVEETFVRTGRIWVLRIDGREIRTTSEHPFYARGRGWVTVAELTTSDVLLTEDGRWLPVEAVEDTGSYETVYNFRVADFYTYFVGSDGWNWSVWAHNSRYGASTDLSDFALSREEIAGSQLRGTKPYAISRHRSRSANLNSDDAESHFGLYEIFVNGVLYKIGKADLARTTKSTGLPTRLHQQVRKLREAHGRNNVTADVVEDLGTVTTREAKLAENRRLQQYYDDTDGLIPEGNLDSFTPN